MEREILDRGEVGRWAGGSPFLGYFDSPERRKPAVARGDSVRPPPPPRGSERGQYEQWRDRNCSEAASWAECLRCFDAT